MIKKKPAIVILAAMVIIVILYFFAYSIYGYTVAEDYAYAVKDALVYDVTDLPPYYRLNSRFQSEIPEDFYNVYTIDEFLLLFKKINAIDSKENLFQRISVNSTDKGKKEPCGNIESSDGTIYFIYHHIDIASTLFFEPEIVGWTIDIDIEKVDTSFQE